ncbi:MAG TPA: cell division protein FtsX [Spongiibacteraceae bacterium]|nr:cell division protein FtsX [Spongiibacteraceae bacterium]HCS28298.1 cell division protein FtsX [Spongiibacteraceae bacterium]
MSATPTRRQPKRSLAPVREPGAGASISPVQLKDRWRGYWANQKVVARQTLLRLVAQPASSMMTVLVIGIALALPVVMLVSLSNIEQLGRGWDGAARISLFLKRDVSDDNARGLADRLEQRKDIAAVQFTSASEALDEFRQLSGYGEVLDSLESNPLPGVLVVTPAGGDVDADTSRTLFDELSMLPDVDQAKLDLEWVQRLHAMMDIGKRISLSLGFLLSLGVLLVIGNTIKLAIEARRDEIVVVKLVGGTDAFVRRPFLYTGFWYGLGGGITAWLILQFSMLLLAGPVSMLSGLYESEYSLTGLGFGNTLMLWLTSGFLGWMGAWLVVRRQLKSIEPR